MNNKHKRLSGIAFLGTFLAIFLGVFSLFASTSYAQYSQIYTNNGGVYTYVNNYNPIYIATTNATNITSSSAMLNGQVNGSNLYTTYNVTTWFQYGTDTNLGYSSLQNPSNSGYASFSSNVGALSPNTIYYFRAVAQTPQGILYGNTYSFRTNYGVVANTVNTDGNNSLTPTVITSSATSIGSTSAKFNSFIMNSVDNPSISYFEWGASPSLGNTTPPVSIGTLASADHINTITGLAPGTTYYFRAAAQNSSVKITGATLSFTTRGNTNVSATNTVQNTNTDNTAVTNTAVTNTSVIQPASALGASVIGTGFLPVNLLGWLILLVLALLLVLLSKHVHGQFSNKKVEEKHS